jgi:hypothetical protein
MKNTFLHVFWHQNTYVCTNAISKGRKSGLFVNFSEFPYSWIRIQESQINADPIRNTEKLLRRNYK